MPPPRAFPSPRLRRTLAALGILHRAFGLLNCVKTSKAVSNLYVGSPAHNYEVSASRLVQIKLIVFNHSNVSHNSFNPYVQSLYIRNNLYYYNVCETRMCTLNYYIIMSIYLPAHYLEEKLRDTSTLFWQRTCLWPL